MRLLLISTAFILAATSVLAARPPETLTEQSKVEREVRDLQAQEDMATWARWMFWATLGGVVVGFGGTVAVVINIVHTRDALKEARKANRLAEKNNRIETRPFVLVSKLELHDVLTQTIDDRVQIYLNGKLNVQNVGKTPATSTKITCIICDHESDAKNRKKGGVATSVAIAPGEVVTLTLKESQYIKRENHRAKNRYLTVSIHIEYSDHHQDDDVYCTNWHGFIRPHGSDTSPLVESLSTGAVDKPGVYEGSHVILE